MPLGHRQVPGLRWLRSRQGAIRISDRSGSSVQPKLDGMKGGSCEAILREQMCSASREAKAMYILLTSMAKTGR